ncbi:crossover junction endodeoxyribonuclease RuvC [Tropheryma whipplei]|uniref:Crossover junction endodeoxyribonuclease RuvC n=2 Tax=Tropheryma whipplei TaxID=2039 RepID=Q83GK1_TROWT|nr:crossover junction endodeoxyribonuclease RuvC [Tropheryma whipplei]AAO44364.1 crossover junction endodeoxyribonuclease [Tropheryma whipplei str. Twist]CAD67170.1 crossover junction endodeoxyribonuclease RuvC [Tropheryma whipplei TW08/27]
MRIMAVDPGLTNCGVAVVNATGPLSLELLAVKVFHTDRSLSFENRIGKIGDSLLSMLEEFSPDLFALEKVFAQHNLSTVSGVAGVIGVASYLCYKHGTHIAFHTPSEIKASICGYGNAKKDQIRSMVNRVFLSQDIPLRHDASDALALAVCCARRYALHNEHFTEARLRWLSALGASSTERGR